jgi:Holliday junction resolvase RusA-like endonuclease
MRPIELHVHGVPAPQGSKTAYVRGGRPVLVEGKGPGRQKHATWRQAIATAARDWVDANGHPAPLDGPLTVDIQFWLPKPMSHPKWRWLAWSKPDLDKLVRSCFDSLSGLVIVDDARVVRLTATKVYAVDRSPGCRVRIRQVDERAHTTLEDAA